MVLSRRSIRIFGSSVMNTFPTFFFQRCDATAAPILVRILIYSEEIWRQQSNGKTK